MSSRDDILEGAVRQLREASNPGAGERGRILAIVQRRVDSPTPPAPERALRAGLAAALGVAESSRLRRQLLVWGCALGLAGFAIGVGVGFGVGQGSVVVPPPAPDPTPVQPAPTAAPPPALDAPESPGEPPLVEPSPPAVRLQPKPRAKPRARVSAAIIEPKPPTPLTLAEALELLQRAERALYADNAAWALSLLDRLDERTPRALLHEERIATRILAWCADGQIEKAERLASQARKEAPTSIYGAILERACGGARLPGTHSPRP
jgi:hypothetical protein